MLERILQGEFFTHYQSIHCIKTQNVVKYEALARLRLSDGTILSPADFIPLIENTQKNKELIKFILEDIIYYICYSMKIISFNLSAKDLEDDNIVQMIIKRVSSLPSEITSKICIEILETKKINDYNNFSKEMRKLKNLGVLFSLDDFGQEHSNYNHLVNFEFDYLKIDGELIRDINNMKKYYAVQSIVDYCQKMKIGVVAEHIEDSNTISILKTLKVDMIQGYYISYPTEFPIEQYIKNKKSICLK